MNSRLVYLVMLLLLPIVSSAQILWDKTYGYSNFNQGLTRMIGLSNGGYLLVGNQRTSSSTIITTAFAIRTNANGDTTWTRKYVSSGWNFAVVNDAAEDNDGNLILVGNGYVASPSATDGFILKLNPNGDTIWTRKIVSPQSDGYYNVIIGNDGNYIVNAEEYGLPVVKKINKNKQNMWGRTVTFSPTDAGYVANFSRTQNGYFVFVGTNATNPSMGKTVKLTEAGVEQQSHFNFASLVFDMFTKANYSMIASCDTRLYEFNAVGDTVWSKKYIMNTQPLLLTAAKPTSDGNYITLFNRRNGNDSDVGLMKVAPNGVMIKDTLLFRLGYNETGKDIEVDANGDYIFAGQAQLAGNKTHMFLAKHRKWNQTLGLTEDNALSSVIKLYPNPAVDQITVTSEKLLTGAFSLYNLQGKQIWQAEVIKTAKKVIPLQTLPSGYYILRFISPDGPSFSRKLLKQ
jgi:hypothetical protein